MPYLSLNKARGRADKINFIVNRLLLAGNSLSIFSLSRIVTKISGRASKDESSHPFLPGRAHGASGAPFALAIYAAPLETRATSRDKDLMKQAKAPQLPTDLMAAFYAEAAAFYEAAPWNHCSDTDIFGVVVPGTGELHFVSIMGGGGQCFGIATYRGWEGLQFFDEVANGVAAEDPDIVLKRQNGLLLEFVTKKFLDDFEKEMAEATGFEPADKDGWIIVRELSPGWLPWLPQKKDIEALRSILALVPEFVRRQIADPEWTYAHGDERVPVLRWQEKKAKWRLEWWGAGKIEKNSGAAGQDVAIPPMDELLVANIARDGRRTDARWEAHSFFGSEPLIEGERPFFPQVCVALDQTADLCLGVALAKPSQVPGIVLRDLFLGKMRELGVIPAVIAVADPQHLFGLISLKEAFGIDIEIRESEAGIEFEEHFRKNVERRL